MKTSTFRHKDSITGPAWSGITLVGGSSSSATFPGGNFPPADRLLFPGGAEPAHPPCDRHRAALPGAENRLDPWWESMNAGGMGGASSFASAQRCKIQHRDTEEPLSLRAFTT